MFLRFSHVLSHIEINRLTTSSTIGKYHHFHQYIKANLSCLRNALVKVKLRQAVNLDPKKIYLPLLAHQYLVSETALGSRLGRQSHSTSRHIKCFLSMSFPYLLKSYLSLCDVLRSSRSLTFWGRPFHWHSVVTKGVISGISVNSQYILYRCRWMYKAISTIRRFSSW